MADEIDYKLIGDDLQAVIITLDPNEIRRSYADVKAAVVSAVPWPAWVRSACLAA
jgi:hypothetical protein